MELLELLRILQSSNDQATAEQNKQAIIQIGDAVLNNAAAFQKVTLVLFGSIMILACFIAAMYIEQRKIKRQLSKLK